MAVFLGRWTAFLRAVMPALAGMARMPYARFLAFNAAGGMLWGIAVVLAGFFAGSRSRPGARGDEAECAAIVLAVAPVGGSRRLAGAGAAAAEDGPTSGRPQLRTSRPSS